MAIDTAAKRRRAFRAALKHVRAGMPIPDGTLFGVDINQAAGFYYGIESPTPDATKLIFTALDGTKIEIDPPRYGYETTLKLPLTFMRRQNGSVGVFDAGKEYDRRTCRCVFEMNATDHTAFVNFFKNSALGRGNVVIVTMPSGGGFFPFGPDKGDAGSFLVRMLDWSPSEQLQNPHRWWTDEVELLYMSGPGSTYTLPTASDCGNITLGTVSNVRYPETTFKSKATYAVTTKALFGPSGVAIDLGTSADYFTTEFTVSATQSEAAAIVYYLQNGPRDAVEKTYDTFSLITQSGQYAFCIDGGSSGEYTAQLIQKEIRIVNQNADQFDIDLSLQLVAVA